jgi:hypothetical protein
MSTLAGALTPARRRVAAPRAAATIGAFLTFTALCAGLRPALDSDLGWHLRAGQLTLSAGVATADPFSHTMLGRPWTDNEWLWEAGLAVLNRFGGVAALVAASAVLLAIAILAVYATLLQRRVPPLLAGIGAAVALANLLPYADVRPGMMGVLCGSAFLLILERSRQGADWRWLLALVPIELLWANCHGSFVDGLLLCGLYGAGALWEARRWRAVLPYAGVGAALLLATLANPSGPGLLRFTLEASRLGFNRELVKAWQAPNLADPALLPLWLTIAAILAALLFIPRARLPRTEGLLLVICTAGALKTQELIPLYAVAAAPLLAQLARESLGRLGTWRPTVVQSAGLILAAGALVARPVASLSPASYNQELAGLYPAGAVAYIERQQLPGPMWNDFNWGGYLLTALPRLPVLVDSRTEMYGDAFLHRYLAVANGREPAHAMFAQYGIRLAVIPPDSPLAGELRADSAWAEPYHDSVAAVFQKVR